MLYVIGHKRFNKSLTLDLENRLYDYCFAMESAVLHNGRGNSGIRSCGDSALADRLIRNTYKTLLTRGQKGCYIYCRDKALQRHMSEMLRRPIE